MRMLSKAGAERFFARGYRECLPHLSVDCVVFGFHDGRLRVLLTKWKGAALWVLPGGYVRRRESLDAAAARILRARTGLERLYLRQFHTFGGLDRREHHVRTLLAAIGIKAPDDAWPLSRVVSVGYLALVDFERVEPRPDFVSEACEWRPLARLPELAFDHRAIVASALDTLRASLDSPALTANLLPARFTMPELQRLHEAVVGRRLDRRNFQKRMLAAGIVERLAERRTGGAHRAPFLYRFARRRAAAPRLGRT